MRSALRLLLLLSLLLSASVARAAGQIPALWAERCACTVAVEYLAEGETERRENSSFGTVLDKDGLIVLPPVAFNLHYTPDQYKNFKVYLPGEASGTPATYLGVDPLSGWHFVRADESIRAKLRPVTDFIPAGPVPSVEITDEVWGIGLRSRDEDFIPYVMVSRISLINRLPQETAIAQQEVTAPGLPVFNSRGDFIGIGLSSFGQSYVQFSRNERGGTAVMLINIEETSAFLTAAEAIPQFSRVPSSVYGRPIAWLGTFGLQPVDTEVARFLKLENQSAAVVGEILEGSPAEKAGLKERDVIVALNGTPLPRFRPDRSVTAFIDRAVDGAKPGDTLTLTVLRDNQRLSLPAVLVDSPKLAREASRHFFERLGFTGREYVYSDAILHRAKASEAQGLVAHFVKPGSPAASAGLQQEDWIKEIDGAEIHNSTEAFERLTAIENDKTRNDFVLLVSRGGDTSILRIKLK